MKLLASGLFLLAACAAQKTEVSIHGDAFFIN